MVSSALGAFGARVGLCVALKVVEQLLYDGTWVMWKGFEGG